MVLFYFLNKKGHQETPYQKYRRKASELIERLKCKKELRNIGRLADSVGSLGGGEVRWLPPE